MNKSYMCFKFIGTMNTWKGNIASLPTLKGTNMNIKDLIKTQSSSMDVSEYSFDLPLNFNTVSDDVHSEVSLSKRNEVKYSVKPYTLCGEVNKDFYSYYIPFEKDFRTNP